MPLIRFAHPSGSLRLSISAALRFQRRDERLLIHFEALGFLREPGAFVLGFEKPSYGPSPFDGLAPVRAPTPPESQVSLLDAVKIPFGADQQVGFDDGIRGEAAFTEIVLGEDLEGFAGFDDDSEAFFVLEVEFAVGNEQ